jgi:uncharacterized protein (DUF2141 family)
MHIPTEPYGATQGAINKFGPPKFKDAVFLTNIKGKSEIIQTIVIQ